MSEQESEPVGPPVGMGTGRAVTATAVLSQVAVVVAAFVRDPVVAWAMVAAIGVVGMTLFGMTAVRGATTVAVAWIHQRQRS